METTPARQDEQTPNSRPVNAGSIGDERTPKTLHGSRFEAKRAAGLRIQQRVLNLGAEAAPAPLIDRQDEARLGAIEQICGKSLVQDAPQRALGSEWPEAV